MCFGNLKGDAPTGLDGEAKPVRVSSIAATEENKQKVSSVPKQKSKKKADKEEDDTTTQAGRRVDEHELGKAAKQRKKEEDGEVFRDERTDPAPDPAVPRKQRAGMNLVGGDFGGAFGAGRVL